LNLLGASAVHSRARIRGTKYLCGDQLIRRSVVPTYMDADLRKIMQAKFKNEVVLRDTFHASSEMKLIVDDLLKAARNSPRMTSQL